MTIHQIVEILQSEPKWWTNQLTDIVIHTATLIILLINNHICLEGKYEIN